MTNTDIILIGSGIMSTTLGLFLKTLNPSLKITLIEKAEDIATESTYGWNNAGTGHAGYCELNYTPAGDNKTISVDKAQAINECFDISLQFWAYLVKQSILACPSTFIRTTPHMSFVWGKDNVDFLQQRYQKLQPLSQFSEMKFTTNPDKLSAWIPLVMNNREKNQAVAATKVNHGVDVDFGVISRDTLNHLAKQNDFEVYTHQKVINLTQKTNKHWLVDIKNQTTKQQTQIKAKFVFIGAGGASLQLLQKSNIPEAKGYGGFPVSGQFLVCRNPSIVSQHHAKVYGKASVNAPPMSVPHLDARVVDGHKVLLFGPFAGFTTKFLKQGSLLDWFTSIRLDNIIPIMQVGLKNLSLLWYLIKEITHNHNSRMNALRDYYPEAKNEDWQLVHAGQRVQIIKPTKNGGVLQFGTEVINSKDGTLSALLGASPGASVVTQTVIEILEANFPQEMASEQWQKKIKEIVPSYQESLQENDVLLAKIRHEIKQTLKL